jgi:hypothetical protein
MVFSIFMKIIFLALSTTQLSDSTFIENVLGQFFSQSNWFTNYILLENTNTEFHGVYALHKNSIHVAPKF